MPRLRRVEQPGRDDRPRAIARRARGSGAAQRASRAGAAWPTSPRADLPRLSLGIGELDRVLGGGLVPGLPRAAGRRARDRQVDPPAPGGRRRCARSARWGAAASCTRRARSRPARSGFARRVSGCWPARRGSGSTSSPSTTSGGSWRSPGRPAGPRRSSIRSRRRPSRSSTGRPAASARCASRRCA